MNFHCSRTAPQRALNAVRFFRCRLRFISLILMSLNAGVGAFAAEPPLKPRQAIAKPAKTVVDADSHDTDRVSIKFRDDLPVRLRNGKLTDGGNVELRKAAALVHRLESSGGIWQREHQ